MTWRRQLQPPGRPLPAIRARQNFKAEDEIVDVARHRSRNRQIGKRKCSRRARNLSVCRHDSITRLVADYSRHMRWQPNRAANVAAEFQRSKPARQRRGRASGGAAGRARRIIGIIRRAEDFVVALQVAGINRQIRFSEDNRSGSTQARDRPRVFLGDESGQFRRARGGAHPGGLEGILDGHRNAVQRPADLAARQGGVGRVGFGAGPFGVNRDDAIDRLIEGLDPREEVIEGFPAGKLTPANLSGDGYCTGISKLRHGRLTSTRTSLARRTNCKARHAPHHVRCADVCTRAAIRRRVRAVQRRRTR